MSELSKRVTTGVAAAAVIFLALLWGEETWLFVLVFIAAILMLKEFGGIVFSLSDRKRKTGFLMISGASLLIAKEYTQELPLPGFATFVILTSAYFLLTAKPHHEPSKLKIHTQEWLYTIAGIAYLSYLPYYLVLLRRLENGWNWSLFFFLIVIASDSFAYFTGRAFGKKKLYPLISPKKTLEGTIGGLVGAVAIGGIYGGLTMPLYPGAYLLALALVIAIASPIGDLVESLLKRGFQVKDSGNLLPGHGGLLDRCDSVVFSVPIMYAGARLLEMTMGA